MSENKYERAAFESKVELDRDREELWAATQKLERLLPRLRERLELLAGAIGSSTGAGSGVGGQSHTRQPANVGALDLDRELREFAHGRLDAVNYGGRPKDTAGLVVMSAQASIGFAERTKSPGFADVTSRGLESFMRRIDELIEPSRKLTLTIPCPECGTLKSESGAYVLTARTGAGGLPVARCSECRASWVGEAALRSLAGE